MKLNLDNYVLKLSNFIDKKTCEEILKEIKKLKWEEHFFYDVKENKNINVSGEKELEFAYTKSMNTEILMKKIWEALNEYVVKKHNFKWFLGWKGYSYVKFNKYSKNKEMALHCDHIHSLFPGEPKGIPILSIVGVLNENYTGGDFIMFKNKKIKLLQGDVIVFPSNFLFPHKVTEVKSGERFSFVSWAY